MLNVNTCNSALILYTKFLYFMGICHVFLFFFNISHQCWAKRASACFCIILIKSRTSYSWSYNFSIYINYKQTFIWKHVRDFLKSLINISKRNSYHDSYLYILYLLAKNWRLSTCAFSDAFSFCLNTFIYLFISFLGENPKQVNLI